MTEHECLSLLRASGLPSQGGGGRPLHVNCPFCVKKDLSYHARITGWNFNGFKCFRCHENGSLYRLLNRASGMSFDEYRRYTKTDDEGKDTIEIVRNHLARKAPAGASLMGVVVPPGRLVEEALVAQEPILGAFLTKRHITVETCQRYGARWAGFGGEWALRFIIPIYDDRGRCVSWQGRLVTDGEPRYKTMPGVNITELLYQTGNTEDGRLYIVEGAFDAWRVAPGAAATFSKAIEPAQQRRLVAAKYNEIVFAWDADAYAEAIKAARELAPLVPCAGVVRLPGDEDPDTLGRDALRALPVLWV